MSHRASLLSLLTLVALVCLAPSAGAITMSDYAVTIQGTGTYSRSDVAPGAGGNWTTGAAAQFGWKATIPTVTFIDNHVSTAAGSSVSGTVTSASMTQSIPTPEGPITGSCTGSSWAQLPTAPVISGTTEKPEDATSDGIYLRVMDGGGILLSSCTGKLGSGPWGLSLGSPATGHNHPFEQFFEMPHEAIGMGKIIQLLQRTVTGNNCPGYGEYTETCSLTWKATVTFTRTFTAEIGEPEVKPAPQEEQPQQQPPAKDDLDDIFIPLPEPKPAEHDDMEDLIVPLPARANLDASGSQATVGVLCRTGCSGTAVATPLSRGARAAAAKALARARFTAKPGRSTTIRLRFGTKARRAIRRAGGIRVALSVRPNGGVPQRRTITLRIRRSG